MDFCLGLILLGCWISGIPMVTLGGVALMPNTSSNCPGPIQFTCVGTDVPNTLIWRVNDIVHRARGEYAFLPSHTFPRSIPLNPSLPGVEVLVVSVSISNLNLINITSTLTSTATLLNGATIQCSVGFDMNSTVYHINIIAPPTHPLLECSLVVSPGDVTVSFDSFSSRDNVTSYRVIASPTPSSCSREQPVSPRENYNCSGLVLGMSYSFNISAINCGNQEGPESTIIVHPQVPVIPEIKVFATYNDENSLSQLILTWQQVKRLSISDVCSFDNSLNYTIFLNDSRGGRLEERVVNSDSCNNNLCSTSFTTKSSFSSNQSYLTSVYAVNVFGQSNTAVSTYIENSLQSEVLSPRLAFEDCVTTLLCSSVLAEGPCVVQYGRDSSNLDDHLNVSLNSPSSLPLMDALTQYYFLFEVRVNSTFYQSRRSFMTGEYVTRLTDTNIGLLIVGVIFLILGIIIVIMWISLFIKCITASTKRVWIVSLILLLVAVFLWLVSVCLWIAVGGVVGSQINTCDSKWKSNRDNLIIAAFVFSFISLLLLITASAVAIYHFKKKNGSRKKKEEEFCSACTVFQANLPYGLKPKQRVCHSCCKKCSEKGIAVYQPSQQDPVTLADFESLKITPQTVMNDSTTKSQTEPPHDHTNLTGNGTKKGSDGKPDGMKHKQNDKIGAVKPIKSPGTSACEICKKEYSYIQFNTAHYCEACGKCVCSLCSLNKAYLPYDEEELKRVCDICYEECKKQGIKVYSPVSKSDKVCEKCKTHFQCSENNMMLCPRCRHKESEKKGFIWNLRRKQLCNQPYSYS